MKLKTVAEPSVVNTEKTMQMKASTSELKNELVQNMQEYYIFEKPEPKVYWAETRLCYQRIIEHECRFLNTGAEKYKQLRCISPLPAEEWLCQTHTGMELVI